MASDITIEGYVTSVVEELAGTVLSSAATAGDLTLDVDDAYEMNGDGGTLIVVGGGASIKGPGPGPHGTPIVDNFNRPDAAAPLGAPWESPFSGSSGFKIVSGQAQPATTWDGQIIDLAQYGVQQTSPADVFMTLGRVPSASLADWLYLDFLSDGTNPLGAGFELEIRTDSSPMVWNLYSQPTGATYGVATGGNMVGQDVHPGDSIGLSRDGAEVTAWYKAAWTGLWIPLITLTGLDPAGGTYAGPVAFTCPIDDFGGGLIAKGGEELVYTITDDDPDEGNLTLVSALARDYPAGTPVQIFPPSKERTAYVVNDGQEEALPARIPHALWPLFPVGIRNETGVDPFAFSVTYEPEGAGLVITDIVGTEPTIDGSLLADGSVEASSVGSIYANVIEGTIEAQQIGAIDAGTIVGLIEAGQINTITAGQITGTITAGQIGSVDATTITVGTISAGQIGSVAASTITVGTIASTQIGSVNAATITVGTISSGQIGSVDAGTITVGTITASQISSVAAGSITGSITSGQIGSVAAGTITGSITSSQIGSVNASAISGGITSAQISSVAASTITGSISSGQIGSVAAGTITGSIASTQIGSVNAATITVGTLTSSQIASVAASTITGSITSGQIGSVAASTITGTITSGQIGSVSAATITGTITAGQIGTVNAGQITADGTPLSTISANLGSISAGTVTGATIRTGSSNPKVVMDSSGIYAVNSGGVTTFMVDSATGRITTLAGIGGGNLVKNSSFEDATSPLVNWSSYDGGTATVAISSDSDNVGGYGTHSIKALRSSGTGYTGIVQSAPLGQGFNMPGKTYTLSAWVKPRVAYDVVLIADYNLSGSGYALQSSVQHVSSSTDWTRLTWTYTVPSGTAAGGSNIYIALVAAGSTDYLKVDNVQVEEGYIATAYAPKPDEILSSTVVDGMVSDVGASKITGSITATQIGSVNASAITGSIASTQIGSINAATITVGTISSSQIGSVAASTITGSITSGQIGSVAATTITGSIASTQIGSVNAATITVGTISSTQIGSVAASTITGSISSGQIGSVAATTITGTLSSTQIGSVNATTITIGLIGSTQIGSVNAATITVGQIATGQLAAGSVTASKMTVGSFNNLVADPGFEIGGTLPDWTLNSGVVSTTGPRSGLNCLSATTVNKQISNRWTCAVGDKFYGEAYAKRTGGTAATTARVGIRWLDSAGALISQSSGTTTALTTSYQLLTVGGSGAEVTAPANTTYATISLEIVATDATSVQWDDVYANKKGAGSLVVDGGIDANQINAGAIIASKLTSTLVLSTTIATAAANPRAVLDSTGFYVTDASGNKDTFLSGSAGLTLLAGSTPTPAGTRQINWLRASGTPADTGAILSWDDGSTAGTRIVANGQTTGGTRTSQVQLYALDHTGSDLAHLQVSGVDGSANGQVQVASASKVTTLIDNSGNMTLASGGHLEGTGNTTSGITGGRGAVLGTDTAGHNVHFDWDGVGFNLRFYVDTALVSSLHLGSSITGAAAKAFVIDHPTDEDRYLVHTCLEGPEVGVYYRGHGRCRGGKARVKLPDFFEALTFDDGRTVQVTPTFGGDEPISSLAVSKVEDGGFTVRTIGGENPDQEFDWVVHAERDITVVEPRKDEVLVKGDGPYRYVHAAA